MESDKCHKIVEGSKSYSLTAYKKCQECVICKKTSNVGNKFSIDKKQSLQFICSDCLKSFIQQYPGKGSLKRFIKDKIVKKKREEKAPNIKCRLCGEVIKITKWRSHLSSVHNVGKDITFRDFFISPETDVNKAQRQWFNPTSYSPNPPCGTKINGGPDAKVIFNAIFSNRKKF